jgi:cytochrome bd ubiquinol oxidase subunit II
MTAAQVLLAVLWVGLTLYALLAGADFGAGFWDLTAGGARRGQPHRALIDQVIGPVWEANHVWLIFILVLLWTGFPPVFAAVMSTLYLPLTLVALGIIARGAAFAFRKASTALWQQRLFGAAFALSSVVTPFFLGTVAGAIASGRVPPGLAAGAQVHSWWNPTSALGGVLAVGSCAYLAAAYLCHDAVRLNRPRLADAYRRRGLVTGVALGAVALAGIGVLHEDAPQLFSGLTHRALPLVIASAVTGTASLVLLALRRYRPVRLTAALAVTAILWGWAVAQYPVMLPPGTHYASVSATGPVLTATLAVSGIGALVLLPSLAWLFVLFQRPDIRADRS